jgi:hypothetical protein
MRGSKRGAPCARARRRLAHAGAAGRKAGARDGAQHAELTEGDARAHLTPCSIVHKGPQRCRAGISRVSRAAGFVLKPGHAVDLDAEGLRTRRTDNGGQWAMDQHISSYPGVANRAIAGSSSKQERSTHAVLHW